jgi:hypothetical protein
LTLVSAFVLGPLLGLLVATPRPAEADSWVIHTAARS